MLFRDEASVVPCGACAGIASDTPAASNVTSDTTRDTGTDGIGPLMA